MSELQDDLNLFSGGLAPDPGSPLANIVDAARRYANLDMEAATEILNRLRYIETGDEWDDKIEDIAAEAVNAALGITTEDDE